jgi:hypothetical protein
MISSDSPVILVASFAALSAIAAFGLWTSRINQFFFFSRTVAPDFPLTQCAQEIVKRYRQGVMIGYCVSISGFACLAMLTRLSYFAAFGIALLLLAVLSNVAFARAHKATGKVTAGSEGNPEPSDGAAEDRRVIVVPLLETNGRSGSFLLTLLPPLLLALGAWFGPMAAMHMSLDAFTSAIGSNGADFLSGLGMGLLASSVLLHIQLRYFSRSRTPLARFTTRSCMMLAWIGAVAIALSTLSVPLHFAITPGIRHGILGCIFAFAILRVLYGWTRKNLFPPPQVERNGDEFWRWGLFYYNPSDPTLFIQHRCGPGYTVNFANFLSWPLTLAILGDFGFLFSIHLYR